MSESSLSYLTSPSESFPNVVNLRESLQYQANTQPEKEAFIIYHEDGVRECITFAELYKRCIESCHVMKDLEIKAKEVVVVALENSIEFLIVYFGLIMMGAIPLTTLPSKKDCTDLVELVRKGNAVAIVLPTENMIGTGIDLGQLFENVRDGKMRFILSTDKEDSDNYGCLSLKHLLATSQINDTSTEETFDIDDVAVIMETSGTTGCPKLICHSYRNIYWMFKQDKNHFENMKLFSDASFGWLGGSPLKDVFNGTTRVTMTTNKFKIDPEDMLLIAQRESCNVLEMCPPFLSIIIWRNIPIPKLIKCILTGGVPIPKHFQKLLDSVNFLIVGYGILEYGGISHTIFDKNTILEANIAGTPRPGVSVKIVDECDKIVRRAVTGNIIVQTPFSCLSYLGEDDLKHGNWFDTDDIGYISEKGELFVIGRKVDCLTIGTTTTYASMFEQRIMSCGIEGIFDVVVVPVPDKSEYQKACACIIKKSSTDLTEREVLQTLDSSLFGSRKPHHVVFVDSFPRNKNGKVDRRLMKEEAIQKLYKLQ